MARLQHIPLFVCGSLLLGIHLGVCAPPNLLVYLGGRQPVDRYHMLALLACRVFSFIKSILQVARTRFVCVGAIACAHFLCLHLRSTLVRFLAPGVLVPDPENAVVVSARVLCMCGKGEARRPLTRSNATTCAPALHMRAIAIGISVSACSSALHDATREIARRARTLRVFARWHAWLPHRAD